MVFFGIGAFFYGILEVICRGYTHWSMLLAGGVCFVSIAAVARLKKPNFAAKCIIGAGIITAVEFVFGCIFNLWLHQAVWDYSNEPFNLLGQVCLRFFGLWILASGGAIMLAFFLRRQLYGGTKKPQHGT